MTSVENSTFVKILSARTDKNGKIGVNFTSFVVFGLFLAKIAKKT